MNLSSPINRQRLWILLALFVLGIYAVLSFLDARDAMSRLKQARDELAEIDQKITTIENAKQAPRVAALDLEAPDEIVNRIASALKTAKLPASALIDQSTSKPQRIGKSNFDQRTITINLAPARLAQIIDFCDALRDEKTGSLVRDLTISEPNRGGSGGREKWAVELILTQTIFSPTSQ